MGKALKGPMCTYEFSGGVAMDHSPSTGLVATTVAHEMGHNFGMEHDNDTLCHCPDDKCIMAASSRYEQPPYAGLIQLGFSLSSFFSQRREPNPMVLLQPGEFGLGL